MREYQDGVLIQGLRHVFQDAIRDSFFRFDSLDDFLHVNVDLEYTGFDSSFLIVRYF